MGAAALPSPAAGGAMIGSVRLFVDSLGNRYVVRLAPMERKGALGVDWRLNSVVFETEEGERERLKELGG